MVEQHPDVAAGSTNKYQNWEVVDPEKWVPDGYACVRVDSRGAGRSPGYLDLWSPREAQDLYECIEWAAGQPWSNGKVGLNGISYYAMNQWQVAALQPPHLVGHLHLGGRRRLLSRLSHHGGILCAFGRAWFPSQVIRVQHGRGAQRLSQPHERRLGVRARRRSARKSWAANRRDFWDDCRRHPLASDEYWRSRMPDWSQVTRAAAVSAANWGGQGLHPRGNFEGFVRSASDEKWLEVHGIEHWTHFYTDYGVALAEAVLRSLPQGRGHGLDEAAEGRAPGAPPRRAVRRAPRRTSGRSRARAGRKFYLNPADATLGTAAGRRARRA